jgi:hypothetical protein
MYEKNEKLYMHKISQMEKVIPFFHYEPLILILESETLEEENKKGQINDAKPSKIRTIEEELVNLSGGKDSS